MAKEDEHVWQLMADFVQCSSVWACTVIGYTGVPSCVDPARAPPLCGFRECDLFARRLFIELTSLTRRFVSGACPL